MAKVIMYPMKFNHIYYEKIWGGRKFEELRSDLPPGNIGESWDVSCHERGKSVIENGVLHGMELKEAIDKYPLEILGEGCKFHEFPLLIKIITATDKLSLQVHPDDDYALKHENSLGKSEAWYILEAEDEASIILGMNINNAQEFKSDLEDGTLEEHLNKIYVKEGEVYHIPAGAIHGIGAGCTILEIQQSSDITYRVYDYGRRETHLDKALEVIDFSIEEQSNKLKNCEKLGCKTFELQKLETNTAINMNTNGKFHILTCVHGCGHIIYEGGNVEINFTDSILIPASLDKYEIVGKIKILKSSSI